MLYALLRILATAFDLTQPAPCTRQWPVSPEATPTAHSAVPRRRRICTGCWDARSQDPPRTF